MWRWTVVWQLSTVLLVASFVDFGFFSQRQYPKVDCFTVPMLTRDSRLLNNGWRSGTKSKRMLLTSTAKYPISPVLSNQAMARRFDQLLLPSDNEIMREHAKLVQDINSLKQVVFIAPLVDEFREYDDSIFHELIETSTTIRPLPQPPKSTKSTSIPIIILGGESQKEIVKTQPVKYPKPIPLVGTSVSPLLKHPYPFVMQAKAKRPFKVCMQPMSLPMYTTPRPSLLQRLINSIIPR